MSKYYKRGFLNKGTGVASIEVEVDGNYSFVKVSDCNKSTTLSFDTSDKKETSNSVYKINKLLSELQSFKTELLKATK